MRQRQNKFQKTKLQNNLFYDLYAQNEKDESVNKIPIRLQKTFQ